MVLPIPILPLLVIVNLWLPSVLKIISFLPKAFTLILPWFDKFETIRLLVIILQVFILLTLKLLLFILLTLRVPVPISRLLLLVFIRPEELIRNRWILLVLKIKSELLLKIVVLIVPIPTSRLVIGMVLPIPIFPFLSIITFKLVSPL